MRIICLALGLVFYININGMSGAGGPAMAPVKKAVSEPFGIKKPSALISGISFRCASKDDLIVIMNTKTSEAVQVQAASPAGVTDLGIYGTQFRRDLPSDPSETIIPADSVCEVAKIDWRGSKNQPNLLVRADLKCRVAQVPWKKLVSRVPVIYLYISTSPLASTVINEEYIIYRLGNSPHSRHSLSGELSIAQNGSKVHFNLKPATSNDFSRKIN